MPSTSPNPLFSPPPPAPGSSLIPLEEGWRIVDQQGLSKLYAILQGGGLNQQQAQQTGNMQQIQQQPANGAPTGFTNEEYARLYT